MKKSIFTYSLLLSSLLAAGAASATSTQIATGTDAVTHSTLKECTKLLPADGKTYTLTLTSTIKKDGEFHGEFNVGHALTDGQSTINSKEQNDEETQKIQPFVACFDKLLK